MTGTEWSNFSHRVDALESSRVGGRFHRLVETALLLRRGRLALRDLDAAIGRAVQQRARSLEDLGRCAVDAPDAFTVTGVFSFKEVIADLEDRSGHLEEANAELLSTLRAEHRRFVDETRASRARLAALQAADESYRSDAPSDDLIQDPLAEERRRIQAEIMSLTLELDSTEKAGAERLSRLKSEFESQKSRMMSVRKRAGSVRRDLGRALIESPEKETDKPALIAAREASRKVEKLQESRKRWRVETERVDRQPLVDMMYITGLSFAGSLTLWLIFS